MNNVHDPAEDIRRLDPIDSPALINAWASSRSRATLLEEITAMPVDTAPQPTAESPSPATHPPRSRRVLRYAVGVAFVAAALVVSQGLFTATTPAYAVRPLPDGVLAVDMFPQFRDGDALASELRSYGVDVVVRMIAASPSQVGEVSVFVPGGGDYIPAGISFGADGTADVFHLEIDPNVFTEALTIEVAVETATGQPYELAAEVFEPGEVLGGLHCAIGEPLRAADLAPYLEELGITPHWFEVHPTADPSITQETEVDGVPDGRVLSGYALDSSSVSLRIHPDGVSLDSPMGRLSDVPCTPEQASSWNRP